MANKRAKPEEIVTKLREAEVLLAEGVISVGEVVRRLGVTEVMYYLYGWLTRCKGDVC